MTSGEETALAEGRVSEVRMESQPLTKLGLSYDDELSHNEVSLPTWHAMHVRFLRSSWVPQSSPPVFIPRPPLEGSAAGG